MRIGRVFIVLIGVLALMNSICVAEMSARPVKTTDKLHLFVKMLESQYDKFLEAEKQGDIEAYRKIRTKETITSMEEYLKKLNKLDDFASMIQKTPSYDYRNFQFIICDTTVDQARPVYVRDSDVVDASGKPRVEFLIIMFHFEEGSWRIGYIGHIGSRKFQDNGTPMTFKDALQEMASPEKFRLSSE